MVNNTTCKVCLYKVIKYTLIKIFKGNKNLSVIVSNTIWLFHKNIYYYNYQR